jgi:hypothetical protein
MKPLAFVLMLAACGGSTAGSSNLKRPGTPAAETAEDWRANLNQFVGTWQFAGTPETYSQTCRWIADSTFLACHAENKTKDTWLVGWEPNNRRYVWWAVAPSGEVEVFSGMIGGNDWQLASATARIGLHRDAPTRWTLKIDRPDGGGVFVDGVLTTTTAPAAASPTPPAKTSSEDWRSALEGFTGRWTFEGTAGGQPATFKETCAWITGATFVLCKHDGEPELGFFGWEPHNARYVHYGIDAAGVPFPSVGTRADKVWTFTGTEDRFTITRESGLKLGVKVETKSPQGGWTEAVAGTLTTQIE